MIDPFSIFEAVVRAATPRTAVVLGSGLADAVADVREIADVAFTSVPGLAPTTVAGHLGRLVLADWHGRPVLISFGRLHFYEGHSWDAVTGLIRTIAGLGVKRLVLTNAAGGIHSSLGPGQLMVIRKHFKVLEPEAWRNLAEGLPAISPYSPRLIDRLLAIEAGEKRELLAGTYAAVTGPCYETPAEIRALQALGADAVGMSTAREAEAGSALGLDVAAISCITNRAAGLGQGRLDHGEVLENARLAVGRLGLLIGRLIDSTYLDRE